MSNVFTRRMSTFSTERGMLVLRLSTAGVLFLRHGWEKRPGQWQAFASSFPDPIGIGPYTSFLIAFVGDFVCPVLIIAGLGTRWAAAYAFGNIFVAWALVHHFVFFGKAPAADHGTHRAVFSSSACARDCRRRICFRCKLCFNGAESVGLLPTEPTRARVGTGGPMRIL